jgi:hypothetical protein
VRGLTARLVRLTGQVSDNAHLSRNCTYAYATAPLLAVDMQLTLAIEGLIG